MGQIRIITDTASDMSFQNFLRCFLQNSRGCKNLIRDCHAIAVIVYHLQYSVKLSTRYRYLALHAIFISLQYQSPHIQLQSQRF